MGVAFLFGDAVLVDKTPLFGSDRLSTHRTDNGLWLFEEHAQSVTRFRALIGKTQSRWDRFVFKSPVQSIF